MKKIISFALLFIMLAVMLPVNVLAQENSVNAHEPSSTPTHAPENDLNCRLIIKKLQDVLTRHHNLQEKHNSKYNRIRELLENVIRRLEEKGIDATVLKKDLHQFNRLVNSFNDHYNKFYTHLKKAMTVACSNDRTDFKFAIQAARSELKEVKKSAAAIRVLLRQQIIPHLRRIRLQLSESDSV